MQDVSGEEMHEDYDREIMSREVERDNYVSREVYESNTD